ncbi:hypothetical protein [Rhizobium sp. AG207R]|uniref:hypothetical protein n=1 Tax=Rhizobium sp. AG207R TaxID=2802287 RepID=UPI0022AC4EEA|nr:hypothetical protein [Rhizobium sp. AG207R]MCZ3377476.1 hypothetical protein [Rhizobium sp. AG207R]
MVKQTHTVATDALATLGTIIDENAGRDAIHLAVEPVIAVEKLYPGQHVGFVDGGVGTQGKHIGIVDPFLEGFVAPGQHFWLVVYPRTITSLRHVWEHPAFSSDIAPSAPVVTEAEKKAASEKWLRDFISNSDCPDYKTVIAAAIDNADSWSSEYLHFNGQDAHGEIPPEFWDHIEIVTGHKIRTEDRATYFSCSC